MVSYDSTQIALFLAIVLAFAATGVALALGVAMGAWTRSRRVRTPRPATARPYGRLAFHH